LSRLMRSGPWLLEEWQDSAASNAAPTVITLSTLDGDRKL
jgi:hypothetical protein